MNMRYVILYEDLPLWLVKTMGGGGCKKQKIICVPNY